MNQNVLKKDQSNSTSSTEIKNSKFPTYRWWVPVSITNAVERDFSENNTRPAIWLTPNELSAIKHIGTSNDSWIIANILASGYYRVNYDQKNWELLEAQLKNDHEVIHPINRAYLIDDAFALAATEILPYTTAFNLIGYLPNEKHYVPWSSALKVLNYIGRMFSYTENHGRYKVWRQFFFSKSIVILDAFVSSLSCVHW